MTRLIHYGAKPLGAVLSLAQWEKPFDKPQGLWVSVDDAWKRWCEDEDFHPECLVCASEIVLRPDAKILHISTVEAFDTFCAMYVCPEYRGAGVWWSALAETHAGIIIAPYLYERRLGGPLWYYGWDCASGCIWDAEAIAEVRPLTSA